METRLKSVLFLAAATLAIAGCSSHQEAEPSQHSSGSPEARAEATKAFSVKGTVIELFPEQLAAKIKHEEIPDYMPAMTMNLSVKDAKELAGLAAGDEINFRLNVTEEEHWIDLVQKIEIMAEVGTPQTSPKSWRLVREVEPLKVGDLMTNYDFTNELGQAVSLKDLNGTAYAFTFIFTRCPLPDFCPRMSSHFGAVQKALAARADGPGNWRLLSITMDPEFDTPLVLKTYARRFECDPATWSHLTGALIDITAIGEQFGLEFYKPDGTIAHNLRTVVVDAAGRVQNILIGNFWKPEELVEHLVAAAAAKPDAAPAPAQ